MNKARYYAAPELFKKLGNLLKQTLEQQSKLNEAGIMMTRIELRTKLKTSTKLTSVNFPQNRDLYLNGNKSPSHLAIKVTVDAVAKAP